MKAIILLLKLFTVPMWLPLWLLWRSRRVLGMALLVGLIDGCATRSGAYDKSPCACDFQPINEIKQEEIRHA